MHKGQRLYSTTVGYYSHLEGARYISPIATGARFPQLVELHEAQHEYLALANCTDGLGRLFALVIDAGKEELSPRHKKDIERLFSVIYRHTVDVHEIVATYVSFLAFSWMNRQGVRDARLDLPPFYRNALQEAEAAFGPIDDARVGAHDGQLLLYCAEAAMNVPYPMNVIGFDKLDECIELVAANSPNARLRRILSRVSPMWQKGGILRRSSIFAGLRTDVDSGAFQLATFQRIREGFPDLQFITFHERPTLFREWVNQLSSHAELHGYKFLGDIRVLAHPEDTAVRRMTANISLPGLRTEDPLDLSLARLNYSPESLLEMRFVADLCAKDGCRLFCHVIAEVGKTGDSTPCYCFCFSTRPVGGRTLILRETQAVTASGFPPFVVKCSFQELTAALATVPKNAIILKIDERCGVGRAVELALTGNAVFLLAHDTTAWNLINLVRAAAETQRVILGRVRLQGDEFSVFLATFERDRVCLIAPITKSGTMYIERALGGVGNVVFPGSEDDVKAGMLVPWEVTRDIINTCFIWE
jgi:hypothetical protein